MVTNPCLLCIVIRLCLLIRLCLFYVITIQLFCSRIELFSSCFLTRFCFSCIMNFLFFFESFYIKPSFYQMCAVLTIKRYSSSCENFRAPTRLSQALVHLIVWDDLLNICETLFLLFYLLCYMMFSASSDGL